MLFQSRAIWAKNSQKRKLSFPNGSLASKSISRNGRANKKPAKIADSLMKSDLVQDFGPSTTYNTNRNEKSVKSQVVDIPQGHGDEGNRTPRLLVDEPKPAPSRPHDKNIIPQILSLRKGLLPFFVRWAKGRAEFVR